MLLKLVKYTAFLIILTWLIKVLLLLDLTKQLYNHSPTGGCVHINGIVNGSEDMQLMPDGNVLITNGLVYANKHMTYDGHGKVFMVNTDNISKQRSASKRQVTAVQVKIRVVKGGTLDLKTFNPHGLTAWGNKVYIVNHGGGADSIEMFLWQAKPPTLTHLRAIRHELIYSLNDVVAVSEDTLYASNDHYFPFGEEALRILEQASLLPLGNLIKIAGLSHIEVVDSYLQSPNGLAFDATRKHLYLSLIGARSIRVYTLTQNAALPKVLDIPLGVIGDNPMVDTKGNVWVGCHPIGYKVMQHLKNPESHSAPSQVLRISEIEPSAGGYELSDIFVDDGRRLSASATAIVDRDVLLIGTVVDRAMACWL